LGDSHCFRGNRFARKRVIMPSEIPERGGMRYDQPSSGKEPGKNANLHHAQTDRGIRLQVLNMKDEGPALYRPTSDASGPRINGGLTTT